jgi:hypothetical protein
MQKNIAQNVVDEHLLERRVHSLDIDELDVRAPTLGNQSARARLCSAR